MIARSGAGITEMANMNPDSRKAGRKVMSIAIWVASSCDRATAEMNIPSPRAPSRKKRERTISRAALPRNGTANSHTPSSVLSTTSSSPMAR